MTQAATLFLLLAAATSCTEAPPQGPARKAPNIVFFMVDDMGWMDSTPYGSTYYETPSMERFASQSMRFTDAYALPLCSPTRASILSGQHAGRHGVTGGDGHLDPPAGGFQPFPADAPEFLPLRLPNSKTFLDPAQYTLAEALRDAGYRTAHFGKWHLGKRPEHWPEKQGFQVAWHAEPSAFPASNYFSPYRVFPPGSEPPPPEYGRYAVGTITDGPDGEYLTDRLTDEALAFLAEERDQPFFLNVWHFGVHGPWGHKPEYTETFVGKEDPSGRQANPIMASMLKSIDDSLGRIMGKLEELGIEDETLVIFYSDNGGNVHSNLPLTGKAAARRPETNPAMIDYRKWAGFLPPTSNAPLRGGKGDLLEGGQRVPLMVRWPGKIAAGSTSSAIVGPVDFYPTLLAAAGVKPPSHQVLDGLSLMPILTRSGSLERDAFYSWFPDGNAGASVRLGDWKLIRRLRPHGDFPGLRELYHLGDDIGEAHNLAHEHPGRVRELDALLEDYLRETGALYPRLNPRFLAGGMGPSARGLVPDQCQLTPIEGGIHVEAVGSDGLIGTALVQHTGPMELSIRLRSEAGGSAHLEWTTADQDFFPRGTQGVSFDVVGGGEWQDVRVKMPVDGTSETVRLRLPESGSPWDIQSMTFRTADSDVVVQSWLLAEH